MTKKLLINNQTQTKYYVFNIRLNRYTHVFNNFENLIAYCADFNSVSSKNKNYLFDDLSFNFNDTIAEYTWDDYKPVEYKLRNILIIDQNYRAIDIRIYKDLIYNYKEKSNTYINPKYKNLIFRKSPIPHTSKHGGKYERILHLKRIRKAIEKSNYIDYDIKLNKYTNNSPLKYWDESYKPRHNQKSWKQKKIKRQWQKNTK